MNAMSKKLGVVLAAAGSARRMGQDKLMLKLGRYTVLQHSALAFAALEETGYLALVTRRERLEEVTRQMEQLSLPFPFAVLIGGATRQESVAAGVKSLPDWCRYCAIHDAARPLVTREEIARCLEDAVRYGAACLSVPVKDTIQQGDGKGFLAQTPDRSLLYCAQTPQIFLREEYLKGLELAQSQEKDFTDDCQIYALTGKKVYLTPGSYSNFKITTPEDVPAAERIFRQREQSSH